MYFPEKLTCRWIEQAYDNGMTPYELLDEVIKRAKEQREKNIWIVEPSRELAGPYIDRLPKNRERYPLWGIPFAIKDNIDLAGVPTTAACPDYAYIPEKSAYVVQKLIEAGAIPVGKTNLDQFATGLVGTRSPYGEVHNAYQPELISGGSSSGSGVSVGAGIVPFALGTDTAGSGRVPAMLHSLIGYKPPRGSWSSAGVVPACASLDCVTVMTHSLDEARLIDQCVRGYDPDCIWSRKIEKKGEKLPEKIYLPAAEPRFYGDYAEIYRKKWHQAVNRLENLGIPVEYIDYAMFEQAAAILYEGAYVAERWEALQEFVEGHPGKTFPVTEQILRSGAKIENTAAKLFENLHELQAYRHRADVLLKNAVMVMPTAGGTFRREQVRENPIETNSLMGLYTNHCNLLDLAAIAVPENSSDREYPFGITIFGLHDAESVICKTAERFLDSEPVKIAVCGLHKQGRQLEYQLTELGGTFLERTRTDSTYHLYELNTSPVKPGLLKNPKTQGNGIEADIFLLPKCQFGAFMERVPSPLTIGEICLENKECVKGFLCESYAAEDALDITKKGRF